ncbi:MAG: putative phosphohydrolase, partial [Candidatus Scalindua rubra]
GILTDRFNWMVEKLKTSYDAIKGYSDKLEVMVNERTKDLAATAQELEKKVEEIEHARNDWETTFDSISDLISIHDKEFNIVRCNKAVARKFNLKPEDIIGKKCYEIFHGTNRPWHTCPYERCRKTLKPETEEVEDPHMGGVFLISCFPRFGEGGKLIGIVDVAKDITNQKRIEKQEKILREVSERLDKTLDFETISKTIFDYLDQIIPHDHTVLASIDSDTQTARVLAIQNKGEPLYIKKGEWVPLKNTSAYLAYKKKDIIYRPYKEIQKSELPFDIKLIKKEKIKRDIIIPLILGNDVIGFLVLASRGIDTPFFNEENKPFLKKIANILAGPVSNALLLERIKESEEKYHKLFETVTDGIVFTNLEGNILDCNKGFLDMLGYSMEEIRTKNHRDNIPAEWHDMKEKIVKEQIMKRGHSEVYELQYIKKDGTVFPISVRSWLIKDEEGKAK